MLDFNFDPFPNLNTQRLFLRAVNEGDADEVLFLRSDKKVLEYISVPHTKSKEEAIAFIRKVGGYIKNNESIYWAIVPKGETKLVGTICIWNIAKEHHRGEIGYVLHPAWQGKGIMQEAITEVLHFAFNKMKLHSIAAELNPKNIPSIKLLQKNGFKKEAYLKENYFFENKFYDTEVYGLLRPKEIKA